MSTQQSAEIQENGTFFTQRVLSYPAEQIFEAFARKELLERWWGPSGFTNSFEIFEFQPDGQWKFVMHGPDGSNHPNESVFLEINAPHTLVIQHVSQPHFVLTVSLTPHKDGTTISWVQKFEDSEIATRIRHIVEPANEQNLDRLESVLAEERTLQSKL